MLAMSLRVRPCDARSWFESPGRFTVSSESVISTVKPGSIFISSLPFGPSTLTVSPRTSALTPFSSLTGNLPIRDIDASWSPHAAQNLAANALAPRFAPGHHPEWGRHYLHAQRAAGASNFVGAGIAAHAGTADPLDAANDRFACGRITHLEHQLALGDFAADLDTVEKTLCHQHAANRLADPRMVYDQFVEPCT